MEPIRRWPIKRQSKGLKETNTKSRSYRTERQTYQKSTRRCGGSRCEGTDSMDPLTTYYVKGDVIWALGPKAKHEIIRGQWGKELKNISLQELLKLFKKTFSATRNVFHIRAHFFNIKLEDNETLNDYWKRLVDTEKKCEFNTITPEDIITYKFAASINDKKPATNSSKAH